MLCKRTQRNKAFNPAGIKTIHPACLRILGLCLLFVLLGTGSAFTKDWQRERRQMVAEDLKTRGIDDSRVLSAMAAVERHRFVPDDVRELAYSDRPLPIGEGQTISQPYVVALMTQLLEVEPGMKVLEIGTGSGYQAAVLHQMGAEVYTIEIIEALAERTRKLFEQLGLPIELKHADGYFGWPEQAPFDRIIITAAANHIPRPLLNQLKPGGRLILPLGNIRFYQNLTLVTKLEDGQTEVEYHGSVRFVPMTGKMLE